MEGLTIGAAEEGKGRRLAAVVGAQIPWWLSPPVKEVQGTDGSTIISLVNCCCWLAGRSRGGGVADIIHDSTPPDVCTRKGGSERSSVMVMYEGRTEEREAGKD